MSISHVRQLGNEKAMTQCTVFINNKLIKAYYHLMKNDEKSITRRSQGFTL